MVAAVRFDAATVAVFGANARWRCARRCATAGYRRGSGGVAWRPAHVVVGSASPRAKGVARSPGRDTLGGLYGAVAGDGAPLSWDGAQSANERALSALRDLRIAPRAPLV